FVGRSAPLERLGEAWTRALAGSEQLAFVAGEPGVGKTRLVAELALRLHGEGATVLYGRCEQEALMPYQPIVEALRHAVRSGAPLGLPADLAVELGRLVPELRERDGALAIAPVLPDPREP